VNIFYILAITFKCYRVLFPLDWEGDCHETKSFTVIVSPTFQDIGNDLDWFHSHKTMFIFFFFINIMSCHPQIWCVKVINIIKPLMKPLLWIILIHKDLFECILPLKSFKVWIVERIITQFNAIMRVNWPAIYLMVN
jgi:hypothetical protein